MTIHHAKIKKAEKLGYTMKEEGDKVHAFWPERSISLVSDGVNSLMTQMAAVQMIIRSNPDFRVLPDVIETHLVRVYDMANKKILAGPAMLPSDCLAALGRDPEWEEMIDYEISGGEELDPAILRNPEGVPLNGATAYREGYKAADCPFTSETEDDEEYDQFVQWNEEFDEAADAVFEEEAPAGSVVADKYRAIYAEQGHPTTCGDHLAVVLNNLCLTKKSTDLQRFEDICAANGVNLSKYNRTTKGWQGRLRMTGRNLLAKKVYLAEGKLLTPVEGAEPFYQMNGEWMAAMAARFNSVK